MTLFRHKCATITLFPHMPLFRHQRVSSKSLVHAAIWRIFSQVIIERRFLLSDTTVFLGSCWRWHLPWLATSVSTRTGPTWFSSSSPPLSSTYQIQWSKTPQDGHSESTKSRHHHQVKFYLVKRGKLWKRPLPQRPWAYGTLAQNSVQKYWKHLIKSCICCSWQCRVQCPEKSRFIWIKFCNKIHFSKLKELLGNSV